MSRNQVKGEIHAGTRTISPDGTVMAITSKGSTARGQTINDVQVFEKT